jgi:hypothetical protein
MSAGVLAGLAVCSNDTSQLCTAVFDNVSITAASANMAADIDAGGPYAAAYPAPWSLTGTTTDDGLPLPANLTSTWTKVSGPGAVSFADASVATTTATTSVPGAYVLRLIADDGQVKTFQDAQASTTLPTVTITATFPTAAEFGPVSGEFTITRTGGTAAPLIVNVATSGQAISGTDYADVGSAVTIPIGAVSATIGITPFADLLAEGDETATLTIAPDSSYVVGAANTATVTIANRPVDAWRWQKFGANANDAAISADLANPDGDVLCNLLEYALAAEPLAADLDALPVIGVEGSDATLTYRRPAVTPELAYSVENWSALNGWQAVGFTEQLISENGGVSIVKDRVPLDGATSIILRLSVTRH